MSEKASLSPQGEGRSHRKVYNSDYCLICACVETTLNFLINEFVTCRRRCNSSVVFIKLDFCMFRYFYTKFNIITNSLLVTACILFCILIFLHQSEVFLNLSIDAHKNRQNIALIA